MAGKPRLWAMVMVSRMYPALEARAHGSGFALAWCRPSPSFRMGCRPVATLGRTGSCAPVTWPLVHAIVNTHDDLGADRKSCRLNVSTARRCVPGGGHFGLRAPLAGFVPSRSASDAREVRGAEDPAGHGRGPGYGAAAGEHDGAAAVHGEPGQHCDRGPEWRGDGA